MKLQNTLVLIACMVISIASYGQNKTLKMNKNTTLKKSATLNKATTLKLKNQIPIFKVNKAMTEQVAQSKELKLAETATVVKAFKKADNTTAPPPSTATTSAAARRSVMSAGRMFGNRSYLSSTGTVDGLRRRIYLTRGRYYKRVRIGNRVQRFANFANDLLSVTTYSLGTRSILVTAKVTNRSSNEAITIKISSEGNEFTYNIAKGETKDIQYIVSPTRRGYYRSYISIDSDDTKVYKASIKSVVTQEL